MSRSTHAEAQIIAAVKQDALDKEALKSVIAKNCYSS
jgi:hypothetical protein